MNSHNEEKQLELPDMDTGFYAFITKEAICFPETNQKDTKYRAINKPEEHQVSFAF
jgi:hypothetical protein|tara:strand:- start:572 stop:739 length:168 start_codon:yes stop_codon:yes gene_type:complete